MGIFDFNDGDMLIGSGNTQFDTDGNMMINMGGNMAMDVNTGELHMVSNWDDDDDD